MLHLPIYKWKWNYLRELVKKKRKALITKTHNPFLSPFVLSSSFFSSWMSLALPQPMESTYWSAHLCPTFPFFLRNSLSATKCSEPDYWCGMHWGSKRRLQNNYTGFDWFFKIRNSTLSRIFFFWHWFQICLFFS